MARLSRHGGNLPPLDLVLWHTSPTPSSIYSACEMNDQFELKLQTVSVETP